jgi:hypothetical protein
LWASKPVGRQAISRNRQQISYRPIVVATIAAIILTASVTLHLMNPKDLSTLYQRLAMKEPPSARLVRRIAGAQLGLGLACVPPCSLEAIGVGALGTVRSFYETLQ